MIAVRNVAVAFLTKSTKESDVKWARNVLVVRLFRLTRPMLFDDCASDQVQEQTIQPANVVIAGNGEACGSIAPPAPAESQAGIVQ